jgi:hypothetical protein
VKNGVLMIIHIYAKVSIKSRYLFGSGKLLRLYLLSSIIKYPLIFDSLTKIKQQNQSNLALPVLVAGYLDYDILGE